MLDNAHVQAKDVRPVDDNHMIGPGAHEQAAHSASMDGDNATATVYAILALAAAVNRLTIFNCGGYRGV